MRLLSLTNSDFSKVVHAIHKQMFLEALSWQGGGGHNHSLLPFFPRSIARQPENGGDVEELVTLLKSLEKLSTPQVPLSIFE